MEKLNLSFVFKILRRNILAIALFLWATLIFYPSLLLNFSLVDDGHLVKVAHEVTVSLKQLDFRSMAEPMFEREDGRVRPFYWIAQTTMLLISFYNPGAAHFTRLILLFITILLINLLLKKFGIPRFWRLFSILIFFMNFQNFENFYRLGPPEPILGVYYLLTLLILFEKETKRWHMPAVLVMSVAGTFTKEIYSLLWVPLFGLWLLLILQKKKKDLRISKNKFLYSSILLASFGLFLILVKNAYGVEGRYSSYYSFEANKLFENLTRYKGGITFSQSFFLELSLIYLGIFLVKLVVKRFKNLEPIDFFYITLWAVALSQLAALLPWEFVLGRYLLLVNLSLVMIYATTLHNLSAILYRRSIKIIQGYNISKEAVFIGFSLLLLPTFFVRSFFDIVNYQLWERTHSEIALSTTESLAQKIPENAKVYTNYKKNDTNLEVFVETGWHLEEFFGRNDVKFEYLDEDNLCTKKPRYIFDRTSDRLVDPKEFEDNSKFLLIDRGESVYEPINYGFVMRSFLFGNKLEDWSREIRFDWTIYLQKENTCISKDLILYEEI